MVLPQHVLREGMWSDGEGPSLLVGILWFPFWHLFLSVLRALLTPPILVSFPVKEEEGQALLCSVDKGKRRTTGTLSNGGLEHMGDGHAAKASGGP